MHQNSHVYSLMFIHRLGLSGFQPNIIFISPGSHVYTLRFKPPISCDLAANHTLPSSEPSSLAISSIFPFLSSTLFIGRSPQFHSSPAVAFGHLIGYIRAGYLRQDGLSTDSTELDWSNCSQFKANAKRTSKSIINFLILIHPQIISILNLSTYLILINFLSVDKHLKPTIY